MSFLDNIRPSSAFGPTRLGIASIEGFGKTTLLAHMPRPIFAASEVGNIPRDLPFHVPVIELHKWEDVFPFVQELTDRPHDFDTLNFDSVDWFEQLIHRFICERDSGRQTEMNPKGHKLESIEDYAYGKGYIVAEEEWRKLIVMLDRLQAKKGMHIGMAAHVHVKKFSNPSGSDYDRYEIKAHTRIARVCVEWSENWLFGFFDVDAGKLGDEKKAKGVTHGRRILGTRNNALYDAKNRIRLPPEVQLGDPRELIPALLGEHLQEGKTPPPMQYEGPAADRNRDAERRDAEQARRNEELRREEEAREARDEKQREADRLRGENERRQREADEERRQQDQRRPQSSDPTKTDGRTWTQPRNPQQPEPSRAADTRAPAPRDAAPTREPTLDERLDDALGKAAAVRGEVYKAKVEGWVKKAAGDPHKIESIITECLKVASA